MLKTVGATIPPKEGAPPVAQLEVRTKDGLTPLMKAAQMGQQTSVEMLLAMKADVSALDNESRSALDWAEHTDRKPIVEALKKAGGERGAIIKRKQKKEAAAAKPTGNSVAPSG